MGDIITIEEAIYRAELRWGLRFKKKGPQEASSSCPFCGQGVDRFVIFRDQGYWCRQCGKQGWLDDDKAIDPAELRLRRIEWEQQRARIELEEHERRLSALERMAACTDHLTYHANLERHPEAVDYWLSEGINGASIDRYKLGYCDRCPTFWESPSYTIPIINGDKLENIRHRLIRPSNTGKYRPHMAGLPASLFNADYLDGPPDELVITEGEKKSIVLAQEGFPNVGISGQRTFRKEWLPRFEGIGVVYVALDPDATESAYRLAALLPTGARVVLLPVKPDEFFFRYGGTARDLRAFLATSRLAASQKRRLA